MLRSTLRRGAGPSLVLVYVRVTASGATVSGATSATFTLLEPIAEPKALEETLGGGVVVRGAGPTTRTWTATPRPTMSAASSRP